MKVKYVHLLKHCRKDVIKITNHRANREELNQLIEEYKDTMNDYIDTTMRSIKTVNSAKTSVSTRTIDSPTIPVFDFFRVLMDIKKIKNYWGNMVDADETGDENFQEAKTEMNQVKKVAKDFYEGLGKNGSNLSALDMNKLQSNLFTENELMDSLLKKLENQEELSDNERRILYYYIQNQYFDGEKRDTMEAIAQSMKSNPDQVKNHLNENVLKTEASLYEELLMTELYLYTGDHNPAYSHLSKEDKALMTAYLEVLYDYRSALEEMKEVDAWLGDLAPDEPLLAKIDKFEYNRPDQPQAFYINTNIIIGKFPADEHFGREDFLNQEDDFIGSMHFKSEISHYESGDDLKRKNNLDARDDLANHTSDFVGDQLLAMSIDVLMKGNPVAGFITTLGDYAEGKADKELQLTEGNAELAANDFGLEIQILERVSTAPGKNPYEIKFLPTDETHRIMDRWKEAADSNSNIPYPEEAITRENWFEISDFFHTNQTQIKESFPEEYDYIFDN